MNQIEINCGSRTDDLSLEIDGFAIYYIRNINISVPLGGVPVVNVDILGHINAKIRGNVHVLETVYVDCETGEEMKSTREVRGG